jgi:hypothetical protein
MPSPGVKLPGLVDGSTPWRTSEDSVEQPVLQLDDGNGKLFLAGTPAGLARPREPDRRHVAGAERQLVSVGSGRLASARSSGGSLEGSQLGSPSR